MALATAVTWPPSTQFAEGTCAIFDGLGLSRAVSGARLLGRHAGSRGASPVPCGAVTYGAYLPYAADLTGGITR